MRKIPVTMEFNPREIIGYLNLRDDVKLTPDHALEMQFLIEPATSTMVEDHILISIGVVARYVADASMDHT